MKKASIVALRGADFKLIVNNIVRRNNSSSKAVVIIFLLDNIDFVTFEVE